MLHSSEINIDWAVSEYNTWLKCENKLVYTGEAAEMLCSRAVCSAVVCGSRVSVGAMRSHLFLHNLPSCKYVCWVRGSKRINP